MNIGTVGVGIALTILAVFVFVGVKKGLIK